MDERSTDAVPDVAPRAPIRAAADWHDVLFVCRKCQKKLGDELPLRKWLKRELKIHGVGKQLRIVDSGCLDLCPKRGVTLALGSELSETKKLRVWRASDDRRGVLDWLLAAAGRPASKRQV